MSLPIEARRHYTFQEHLKLQPLLNALKRRRNDFVSRRFSATPAEGFEAFMGELGDVSQHNLLFTVAFNLPWTIDTMIRTTRHHMPEWRLVVIDNSNKPEMRAEIRAICAGYGVPYLGLPTNPEWSPNRSHGISLDWIWRNIVKPKAPPFFGFIDHDCFPVEPPHELERISGQAVDGLKITPRRVEGAWYLWAGYMFFNSALIAGYELDFNHDQALRLDTAGRNWTTLYRHLDPARLSLLTSEAIEILPTVGKESWKATRIGGKLIHVGGASYRRTGQANDYVATVRALIEKALG